MLALMLMLIVDAALSCNFAHYICPVLCMEGI